VKLLVIEWERVQSRLPLTDDGNDAWNRIEEKIIGRSLQKEVSIPIPYRLERVVHDVIFDLEETLFQGSSRSRESREDVLSHARNHVARRATGVRPTTYPPHHRGERV